MTSDPTGTEFHAGPIKTDDTTWCDEIAAVDDAVNTLLELKRKLLATDPVREHVLSIRHASELRRIKRNWDAICI